LIAFRISEAGFDTVVNIAEKWTYNMVRECLDYLDIKHEHEKRENSRAEAKAKAVK
jgi:hypothetical protein